MRRNAVKRLGAWLLVCCTLMGSITTLARDDMKNTDIARYHLYLNIPDQVLTACERDGNGAYTRVVRRMLCSTGAELTPTPTGTYKIGGKERFGKFANFDGEYARYWTQVVRGIYMHSIGFSRRDVQTLKRAAFANLGKRASHGCIRLYVEDAKWVYYNVCPGSSITIGSDVMGVTKEEKKALKTPLDFAAYKAYQATITDDTAELADKTAWVTYDNAQLRTGNGSNDEFIKRLAAGTQMRVLQEGDPWVKVDADGREGYVKRIHVTYKQGVTETYENGRATKTTTEIYAAPDMKSEVLCRMPRDTSLDILETDPEEGWYKIRYWDIEGFIRIRKTRVDTSMFPYDEAAQLAAYAAAHSVDSSGLAAEDQAALAAEEALLSSELEQDDLLDAGFAG